MPLNRFSLPTDKPDENPGAASSLRPHGSERNSPAHRTTRSALDMKFRSRSLLRMLGVGFALTASISVVMPTAAAIEQVTSAESTPTAQMFEVTGVPAGDPLIRDGYGVIAPPPPPPPPPPPAIQWPLPPSTAMSSDFGPRSCAGCSSDHQGIDLTPGGGTPIGALATGVVVQASAASSGAYGVHVTIEHVIDGQMVQSLYAHLQAGSMPLAVGQQVSVGQTIGLVGSTGRSTGDHLHFEIRPNGSPVDPLVWLAGRGL